MKGGTLNRIIAKIDCMGANLSYPVNWDYTSIFLDADGKEDKLLTVNIQGQSSNGEIRRTRNGLLSKMACHGYPSCDWCVYETIQRRSKQLTDNLTFDMLESLERLKPGQQLIDRGIIRIKAGSSDHQLHRFDQLGTGNLPFEYWVDESSRLCLMISSNKAYILDQRFGPALTSSQSSSDTE